MIYGIVSYFRSLLITGFFSVIMFILYIELFSRSYLSEISLLYILLIVSLIGTTIFYMRYWKYILMPYSLNFHSYFSHNTFIAIRNKRTLFLDFFIKRDYVKSKNILEQIYTKDLKRFNLEYQNLVSMDIDNYRKNGEKILHYLGLIEKDYEVSIYPRKNKSIQLSFYKLPSFYEIDISAFKINKIFMGIYERGFYYRDINTLDHHLVVGESGSGKSNFMQLLNISFLHNLHIINKIYLIDLKGGVELKSYENIDNVEFVSNIQKLDILLDNAIEDMKSKQEYMKEHNIRKLDTYTLIIFDEIGAISVYPNKKFKESIFNKLALLSMQGRATNHLLFLFGQKIDNTILPTTITNNIQSRVLLKTSNDYNINIIDLKDNIRERITATEIQDFKKGRAIYKNGLTSDKHLIHFPFISNKFLSSSINFFSNK